MSLPLPLFPSRTRENRNRNQNQNQNLACQNVFLDCDERFDIYQVKAAERPHLLHFTAAKDIAVNMEDGHHDREVQTEESSSKENENEPLPIMDGCDLPGWRKEGFVPFASSAIQSVLNVGASCTFFRRDRQWPVLPSNYETGARDDCITCTIDQERSSNRLLWKELKYKFKHIPPKPKHDAMVLDNAIYSEMMEVSDSIALNGNDRDTGTSNNKTENVEGPKRMATKFALEIEQANIPAKIMGGTTDWKCMPKYNQFDDSNSTTTDQKEKENILNDFTGGGRGGWT